MPTSKAFHATLPWLSDADLSRLRAWASENCAASSMTREQGVVVWRATKERARTREAFLRSVRATLKRLHIDVSRLRSRWLVLAYYHTIWSGDQTDGSACRRLSQSAFFPQWDHRHKWLK